MLRGDTVQECLEFNLMMNISFNEKHWSDIKICRGQPRHFVSQKKEHMRMVIVNVTSLLTMQWDCLYRRRYSKELTCLKTCVSWMHWRLAADQALLSKQKRALWEALSLVTGGSWWKSPQKTTCSPPKAAELPRTFLATSSTKSRYSLSTMDTCIIFLFSINLFWKQRILCPARYHGQM